MNQTTAFDQFAQFRHSHEFGAAPRSHERKTMWVVALTLAMMVAELAIGYLTNSLALTADGWHMATHAGALTMAALAYSFARRHAGSSKFSFGTGKVHALAGYTSAVVLALVALLMIVEAVRRFLEPEEIAFSEALPVAVLGLVVNLVSVKLLHSDDHHQDEHDDEHHHHDHEHDEHENHAHAHGGHAHAPRAHGGHGPDHNLRAAYFHVLADALTSVLAIVALLGGRYFGWTFLDAAMGVVGGIVITRWSYGLSRQAASQLLDVVPSEAQAQRIRERIETVFVGSRVVDLHLWDVGPSARACIVSIAGADPAAPNAYREVLASVADLEHVTVEVNRLTSDRRGST